MGTISSVSYSTSTDSFQAGTEMSSRAFSAKNIEDCQFALVFASCEHDSKELLRGVKSVIGEKAKIVGGTSTGIITPDFLGYEGFTSGIMVISSDEISFDSCLIEGLDEGEFAVGEKAGEKIAGLMNAENPNLLLFFDSIKSDVKSQVPYYEANPILEGIRTKIKEWPPVAGVGYATIQGAYKTEIWDQNNILSDALIALVISGNVRMDTTIMHGLKPASDYHKITKVSGNILLEFDDKPAIEVVTEYLGKFEKVDWKSATFLINIGVNLGEKYGPFKEENYLNRMVLGVDKSSGGLVMVEADLKEGDEFQFMRKCSETDMVAESARDLLNLLKGREPLFAFYISCLGRIKKYFGNDREEGEEVQETVGQKIPLLGIYSGVEIAKIRGKITPLDWTGVLCIFSRPIL